MKSYPVDVFALKTPTGWRLEMYASHSTDPAGASDERVRRFPTLDDAWRHAVRTHRHNLDRFIVTGDQ